MEYIILIEYFKHINRFQKMNKSFIIFLFLLNNSFAKDSLVIKSGSDINYSSQSISLKNFELLIDEWYFDGYMVLEINNLKFDSINIYFIKSLNDYNNQQKYYYNIVGVYERSIAISQFKSGNLSAINSLIFYYQLFSNYKKKDDDVFINVIKNYQLIQWIDSKYIYKRDNKYLFIFRVVFETAFLLNKSNQNINLFPLSKLYEFEYLDHESLKDFNFEKTKFKIKIIE